MQGLVEPEQVPPPLPDQERNAQPSPGVAVKVPVAITKPKSWIHAVCVDPGTFEQSMPAGALVTVPLPGPSKVTSITPAEAADAPKVARVTAETARAAIKATLRLIDRWLGTLVPPGLRPTTSSRISSSPIRNTDTPQHARNDVSDR